MLALESPLPMVGYCVRCGSRCIEIQDAAGQHAWWQCILCNNLPYVPLDWRVRWPSTGTMQD